MDPALGTESQPLVLFDGYCNFCNSSVKFIVRRDPRARLRFAPLDSEAGKKILSQFKNAGPIPDSVVLVEDGSLFMRSTAALRIARRLRFPWPIVYGFVIIPRGLRDWVYNLIARHRYRWFGRREACMIPTPELRSRFITANQP